MYCQLRQFDRCICDHINRTLVQSLGSIFFDIIPSLKSQNIKKKNILVTVLGTFITIFNIEKFQSVRTL